MNVNTQYNTAANTPASQPQAATVDYQAFLKLLVAQMKNQDPTSPMESTDYVAQLATAHCQNYAGGAVAHRPRTVTPTTRDTPASYGYAPSRAIAARNLYRRVPVVEVKR